MTYIVTAAASAALGSAVTVLTILAWLESHQ